MRYNHRDRRRNRAWLDKRHDPQSSWAMYAQDAERNSGALPSLEFAQGVLSAMRAAVADVLAASGGLGIGADTMGLCAVLASVGARVATEVTGDVYRVQSGHWWRLFGVNGRRYEFLERTGSGQDFHAWTVSAHPGGRLVMFDPQPWFWEGESTVVWDWQENVRSTGIVWKARTATTAKVVALAAENQTVCDLLCELTLAHLTLAKEAA